MIDGGSDDDSVADPPTPHDEFDSDRGDVTESNWFKPTTNNTPVKSVNSSRKHVPVSGTFDSVPC